MKHLIGQEVVDNQLQNSLLNSVQNLVFNLQKRLLLVRVIRTFKHLKLVNETSYWAGSCG